MKKGRLIIFSGPSGSGKGTILKEFLKDNTNTKVSCSATTRGMRPGEVDGVSYFFLTKEDFENRIENDGFLEWAKYCDNYYGTPKEEVNKMLDDGINVILEIEVDGAMQVKKIVPEAYSIFVMTPSLEVLRERLINRNTEAVDVVNKRIERAKFELEIAENYDYILINDKLEDAVDELKRAVEKGYVNREQFLNFLKENRI